VTDDQRQRAGDDSETARQIGFLQLQISYFTTQLTIADAKAAGVLAFTVAVAGVTAQQLRDHDGATFLATSIGALGLLLSLMTCIFGFTAVWPRRIADASGAAVDLFSWVSVSAAARGAAGSHARNVAMASGREMRDAVSYTTEELACIIERKYRSIRRAFLTLVPATLAHVAYWFLS